MKLIETCIDINAPADRIWQVLTDFSAYTRWNPFIQSVEGAAHQGAHLVVTIAPLGKKPMTFKPTIITMEVNKQLQWRGKLLIPGLFDGQHCFTLEPQSDRCTRLHHSEQFSGLLAPLVFNSLNAATTAGFKAMNEALKKQCESRSANESTS
ncbi:MAG: polyketide cyclase [Coxiella sp. (in: Bacteria)]|nr:MAG: polyketide cyclase [Coxiella sp. (in: g-proteobacteria)]